jgi:hypothetical protein
VVGHEGAVVVEDEQTLPRPLIERLEVAQLHALQLHT